MAVLHASVFQNCSFIGYLDAGEEGRRGAADVVQYQLWIWQPVLLVSKFYRKKNNYINTLINHQCIGTHHHGQLMDKFVKHKVILCCDIINKIQTKTLSMYLYSSIENNK